MPEFDELFEYFMIGCVAVLVAALAVFVVWGIFFSSDSVIHSLTLAIGGVGIVVIALVLIGAFVKERLFG